MHFALRCCDVSSLAGRNVFRSRNVAIRRLVEVFVKPFDVRDKPDRNRELISLIRKGTEYQGAVQNNKLTAELCSSAEEECREIVRGYTTSSLERVRLFRRYQHLYLKDRGLVIEQMVINKLESEGRRILPLSKRERSFSKTFACKDGGHTYTIYGCVDCIEECDDGSHRLFEIKSRKVQRAHYRHEMDQMMIYLVISGHPTAILAEHICGTVHLSQPVTLGEAETQWEEEIRQPLEKALSEAAAQIEDHLPLPVLQRSKDIVHTAA